MASLIKKIISSKKGTSLIELILYFSLLGLVLIIATDIMIRTSEFSLEAGSKNNLQDDGRFIISRLSYDIRRSDSITIPSNIGDASSTLFITVSTDTVNYSLVGTNLNLEEQTGPPTRIQNANVNSTNTNVTSVSFERLGNTNGKHTIKISIELENSQAQKGGPEQKTFETVVSQR